MNIGSFPDIVNENAARWVATCIIVLVTICLIFPNSYFIVLVAFGFLSRSLYGPKYSLVARFVLYVFIPFFKISNIPTAGPPKRFAQVIGLLVTTAASVFLLLGNLTAYYFLLTMILVFAFMESVLNFCFGCYVFRILMNLGLLPKDTCEKCQNINIKIKQ